MKWCIVSTGLLLARMAGAALPEPYIQVSHGLYTGAEPVDAAHFQALADAGIQVLVSVDGARPHVDAAHTVGLRYVHLPMGYQGIDRATQLGLARVMDEATGAVYIHCHHGKHRGPAAAAIAARAAGRMDAAQARAVLVRCGTGSQYTGLWRDVAHFRPVNDDEQLPELVSLAEVGGLAEHMAALDRVWDQLQAARAAGWNAPAEDPDASPPHLALIAREHLTESARQEEAADPPELAIALQRAIHHAKQLEAALRNDQRKLREPAFQQVREDCRSCHKRFR